MILYTFYNTERINKFCSDLLFPSANLYNYTLYKPRFNILLQPKNKNFKLTFYLNIFTF